VGVLTPNSSFGRYTIHESLGRGAMGTVYRATDDAGQTVAIKVMSAALAEDPDLVERFRREAMAAASLRHPNITAVLDFGKQDGQLFMAMELLGGSDLAALTDPATLTLPVKLSVMEQVADGMAFVHAAGLVHRDLKPGNIHVLPTGEAKIMDFGLVRYGDSNMTATGTVMGSPSYMSPELMKGDKADARSDVFSLGAVFYELLAGRRAFAGKGITAIMMAVLGSEPAPLAQVAPDVPPPVARIVERCLRKDPAARYRTAGELQAALEVARGLFG
jgi:serine/threonine-protein kinase